MSIPYEMPESNILPEPGPLPPHTSLPYPRCPLFVGRQAPLLALAQRVKTGGVTVITGEPGIGKTQLAVEFAHRYGRYFPGGVFGLHITQPAAIPAQIAYLDSQLNPHQEREKPSLPEKQQRVWQTWQDSTPRLLIYDSCQTAALLARWLPSGSGCRILVTSQQADWSSVPAAQTMPLPALTPEASGTLLRHFLPAISDDVGQVLAAAFGHMPLALQLTGHFLAANAATVSPAHYLSQVQAEQSQPNGRHPLTPALAVILAHLRQIDPLAASILARAACLTAGPPIPKAWLGTASRGDGPDPSHIESSLARLVAWGLLAADQTADFVYIHPLLKQLVLMTPDTAAQTAVAQTLLNTLSQPPQDDAHLALLPAHVSTLIQAAKGQQDETAADLHVWLGSYLEEVTDYGAAQSAYETTVAIRQAVTGPDHPEVAMTLNKVGLVLQAQQKYAQAQVAFEQALAIFEQAPDPPAAYIAAISNNLGLVLQMQEAYAGAQLAYERAAAIMETEFGPTHPSVASAISNLGEVLAAQKDFAGAQAAHERALAIFEQVFGAVHPNVAAVYNNLGEALAAQGLYEDAWAAFQRALVIFKQVLGPHHPHVATLHNNLGELFAAQGDYVAAQAAHEQALAIDEVAFGPHHLQVATDVYHLAFVLWAQGELARAKAAFERALPICQQSLGPGHPHTQLVQQHITTLQNEVGG